MRLEGKTALVTGAAAGIGRAIAARLAAAGARVIVTDIDGDGAAATAAELGGYATARSLDVTDETAFAAAVDAIDAETGLDIVVNNAGIALQKAMKATTTAEMRRIFEVNVVGVFVGMREAARVMRARGTAGRIINMASISGLRGNTGRTAYGASKAAVVNMTQVAAVELGPTGITVNAVAPGPVETAMAAAMHTTATRQGWARHVPQRRYGTPEEVAAACLYLASDEAAFTTGQVIAVDGGFIGGGLIFDLAADEP